MSCKCQNEDSLASNTVGKVVVSLNSWNVRCVSVVHEHTDVGTKAVNRECVV